MKFIKIYVATLILCYVFVFFGGWMLFDFSRHYLIATAACAFVIAVLVSVLYAQEERIAQLEQRVKALEEKDHATP